MRREPYKGLVFLQKFDATLEKCQEKSNKIVSYIDNNSDSLNDLQKASMQIIPQGIHIALSIRKLIEEAYLFGAFSLMRGLLERTACMSTLRKKPEKLEHWKNGWQYKGRPSLDQMIYIMTGKTDRKKSQEMARAYHHVAHGDPIGASYSMNEQGVFIVGPILGNPNFCGLICYQAEGLILQLMIEMDKIFPFS